MRQRRSTGEALRRRSADGSHAGQPLHRGRTYATDGTPVNSRSSAAQCFQTLAGQFQTAMELLLKYAESEPTDPEGVLRSRLHLHEYGRCAVARFPASDENRAYCWRLDFVAGPKVYPADHRPGRRNRGRKVAKIKFAARTLLNHRVSKALESLQSRDLPFPTSIGVPPVDSASSHP
jgi:hypothetical protein